MTEYCRLVAGWTYRSFWFAYGTPQTAAKGLPNFLPDRVYLMLGILHLLSLLGFALALWRERETFAEGAYRWWAMAGLLTLLVLGAFVRFILTYFQTQGRYLYPVLVPLVLAFVIGWRSLFPVHLRAVADGILLLVLLAISILAISVIQEDNHARTALPTGKIWIFTLQRKSRALARSSTPTSSWRH